MSKTSKRLSRSFQNITLILLGKIDLATVKKNPIVNRRRTNFSDFLDLVTAAKFENGLDLGCGPEPANPFKIPNLVGIDLVENPAAKVEGVDLSRYPIPRPSATVDFISCFDFIEHIPRWERVGDEVRFPFVELLNEISRVLKSGGLFFSKTPAFPSEKAFQDPTHVNFITEATFPRYFCDNAGARPYGFTGQFELVKQGWEGGHLLTLMRRV